MKEFFYTSFQKITLLSLCILFGAAVSFAQRTITGSVVDEQGEALIGANVLVQGTASGTITDIDGNFTIRANDGDVLVISYTGYQTQEITLSGQSTLSIVLTQGTVLDEVVVTGYGTQKAKEVTSAISSVDEGDFNKGAINDPLTLIQGKVAGLSVTQVGSDPNGKPDIRLRGTSTFGANTQPLVVIDGVIGGSLDNLDPGDIASIDVLKDGSAAAIYGTRASSGVIIVTTKKGEAGQFKVEYNVYGTVESVAKTLDRTSAEEFVELRGAANDRGSNTDWIELVTRTGLSHVHNLSFSGGSGKTTYRASLNYRDIEGVGLESERNQLNGRLSLSQSALNDRLTLSLNLSATQQDVSYGFNEAYRYATLYNPTAPVYFPEGHQLYDAYGGYYQIEIFDYFNPVAIIEQNENVGELKDLIVGGRAALEIVDGLTLGASISQERQSDIYGQFYSQQSFFRGSGPNGRAQRNTADVDSRLFETTLSYDTDISSGLRLAALAGYSWQENTYQGFQVIMTDFISDDLAYNNLGSAGALLNTSISSAISSYKNQNRIIGFFGRVNLNFNDNFYVQASLRRDGSSRFGEDNQWGTFPAVSAGVNLTNLVDLGGVDNLKVRVGYGITGADAPSDNLDKLRFTRQGGFYYNGEFVPAFGPDQNANPGLKWEEKAELNAGIDFAFADYRFTGSLDFYDRTTTDLIFNIPVPQPPNLAGRTWANLEDVELKNSGVELALGYNLTTGNGLTWNPNLTFATYSTKINRVDNPDAVFSFFQGDDDRVFDNSTSPGAPGLNDDPSAVVLPNESLGNFWGRVFLGVDDAGHWMFEDLNGDGVINGDDETVIGNGLPDFSLGFQNNFSLNNWDLSFFFRGDFGHELINMWRVFYEPLGTGSRNDDNIIKSDKFVQVNDAPIFSSLYVEGASFVTLDNATLGYTFDLPDNSAFSNIRLYLNGRNLFTITDYSGLDPAVRYGDFGDADNGGFISTTSNPLYPGFDRRTNYFTTRSFTLGATIGF